MNTYKDLVEGTAGELPGVFLTRAVLETWKASLEATLKQINALLQAMGVKPS